MGKKIAAYVGILVFLGSIALGYFFFKNRDREKNVDAFHAVPLDATFLMRVNSIDKARYAFAWLNGAEQEQAIGLLRRGGFLTDTTAQQAKMKNYLLVSSHPTAINVASDRLYLAVFTKEQDAQNFFTILKNTEKVASVSTDELEVLTADSARVYVKLLDRIAAISSSKKLVDASAKQWRSSVSIEDGESFALVLQAMSRNADFNLMVSGGEFTALSTALFPTATGGVLAMKDDSNSSTWLCLDAELRGDVYLLAGFLDSGASKSVPHPLFAENQSKDELEVLARMPYQSTFVQVAKTKNLAVMLDWYEAYLSEQKRADIYLQSLADLGDKLNVNFKDLILSFAPQEVGIARVGRGDKADWLTVLSVPSGKVVEVALNERGVGEKNPLKGAVAHLLGGVFAKNTEEYYAVVDNFLLLSTSKLLVERAANEKKSFLQALEDKRLLPLMSTGSSMLTYVSTSAFTMDDKLPFTFPADVVVELDEVSGKLYCNMVATGAKPFDFHEGQFGTSIEKENKPAEKPAEVLYDPAKEKFTLQNPSVEEKTDSRVLLKKTLGSKRYELSQQKGFVVLTERGKQLWQYDAAGTVLAADIIFPYKKDEAYAVFNTKDKIYLADSKGKNAKGFPLSLKSKATNGIAVFDYSNTRDYRIFVACNDGKIHLFDGQGKSVEGWLSPAVKTEVTKPVSFFRIGGKDYVVVADKQELYILDRRGRVRVTPDEKVAVASDSEIKSLGNPARLVFTDTKGRQVTVSLVNGKVTRK